MNRISKLRFKPPSQIGLKGIQPPPEKGMRLENAADARLRLWPGYGPFPRDLDGRASDKAPARTGTSSGLNVGIGIPLIFVEFLNLQKSRKF